MRTTLWTLLLPPTLLALHGCTATPSTAELDKMTADVVKTSFAARGIATMDRLDQDMANRECAAADVAGRPIDDKVGQAIEAAEMKTIRAPSDGRYLGDWKAGEAIAQSGRGLTWTDKAGEVNGGNCYNCHQIGPTEISYGTLGPSLYNYGKIRGVTDPNSPASQAIVAYTWGKLWNARAFNACSQMPRVGHKGILTEKQLKDVMALLLDPKSPVNQ
jgi:sulfur-oxidizing protein SoxX